MATKTAVVTARIEPDIKDQAETIFKRLGLSVSDALNLYYRNVIRYNGLPFRISLRQPETFEDLTVEEIQTLLAEGEDDVKNGRVVSAKASYEEFRRRHPHANLPSYHDL